MIDFYVVASASLTPALDIYSFGMCALEMAALEIQGNGDSGNIVTEENIAKTVESLEDEQQKDFIKRCLHIEPEERPTARELLFHPLLFEVHSLKLLSAHCLAKNTGNSNISETITDELIQRLYGPDVIIAVINHSNKPATQLKMSDIQGAEKLEKFVEDVKNGIYPLTAFGAKQPPPPRSRAISPEMAESVKSVTPEPLDTETRKIINMLCDVKSIEDSCELAMTILLRMDDKMNRQLTCIISEAETPTPAALAQELVHYGFINEVDRDKIANLIVMAMQNISGPVSPSQAIPTLHFPSFPQMVINPVNPGSMLGPINSAPTQVPMHSTKWRILKYDTHWEVITSFMENYPGFATGRLNYASGRATYDSFWESLTNELNALGLGMRPVHKWQKTWVDFKCNLKKKASALRQEQMKTGGGPTELKNLTDVGKKYFSCWAAVFLWVQIFQKDVDQQYKSS
ncbi:hypothetical protein FQA39_LY00939 [Lamprigera yunnana]|nr:hypothetical protein FQA39_LY00939 [Lamprigera yunnana]